MNQPITIKFLRDCQQHIPYLAQLWFEEISQHWVPNASVERAHDLLLKHVNISNQLPMTFVAFVDNTPIGMASLRENDGIRSDCTPWLGSLIVDPTCRQQGIGEQLIEAVKQQAKLLHYSELYLLAFDPTIPTWYSRLDCLPVGSDQLFGHPVAVMNIAL